MTGEGGAGRSADEQSRRLRQQIERLEARAQRYEQGAVGERRTASVLNPRSGDGWYVLHDLGVPGSAANIDHVVVTPGGVFVIDSKNWTGSRISDGDDTLWVGRYPKRREIEVFRTEIGAVRVAVRAFLAEGELEVSGVVSLTGTAPVRPVLHAGDIVAVAVDDLTGYIARQPARLDPEQVEAIARVIDSKLPGRASRESSLVEPAPLPPRSSPPPPRPYTATRRFDAPNPHRTQVQRPPGAGTIPKRPRPSHESVGRRRETPAKAALGVVAALVGLVVCLAILGATLRALSHTHLELPKIPTTAQPTPTTPTTTATYKLSVSWTCPTPGKGWTASFAWPAGQAPSSFTRIDTATSESGPWTMKSTSRGRPPSNSRGWPPALTSGCGPAR